jgi:hypothetical protein
MRKRYHFQGTLDRETGRRKHHYVAFEMPAKATRLEVSYAYDRPDVSPEVGGGPGNVIDLGVFDARGADLLEAGFRGWSGSDRAQFFIEPQRATPGYLPGPLQPGEWQLLLGAARLEDETVGYHIAISIDVAVKGGVPAADLPAPRPVPVAAPRSGPARWWRGDLHSHTIHSDGYNTVDELAAQARDRGLDFFAVTDHNTVSHFDDVARASSGELLIFPGEEITTYRGHANAWGIDGWVDFRCEDVDTVRRVMDHVHGSGARFSVNHPKQHGPPWLFTELRGYRFMEVWGAPWRWFNHESLEFWLQHLDEGRRVVAVGGSDVHSIAPAIWRQPNGLGEPCTWIRCQGPLDEATVLDTLDSGRVFVSEAWNGPFLELTADLDGDGDFETMMGDTVEWREGRATFRLRYAGPIEKKLRIYRNRDLVHEVVAPSEEHTEEFELDMEGERANVRAEACGFRGRPERGEVVHALTNPVFFGSWA